MLSKHRPRRSNTRELSRRIWLPHNHKYKKKPKSLFRAVISLLCHLSCCVSRGLLFFPFVCFVRIWCSRGLVFEKQKQKRKRTVWPIRLGWLGWDFGWSECPSICGKPSHLDEAYESKREFPNDKNDENNHLTPALHVYCHAVTIMDNGAGDVSNLDVFAKASTIPAGTVTTKHRL